ncbi:probable carboxylesterase 15 [Brachypodium distachyon]|uniref:Alpha/beta hydrolase fold-3 domain-containing protein n=1 Tax=Brachypodium distachyon TaxID=15368 RepID=I1HK28_BRADI|nr:probable carboxylesterase 15 [Brachypodium distachyon]KQK06611.1 hypothetical protein BRADI_2g27300v3 [Brachypodium distachyon]|eukprot:XP_003568581.1 probable carboxylesterase 15 [Brachypodium distachyon]
MSSYTAPQAQAHVVEDFFGVVQLRSDGSVIRGDESVLFPPEQYPEVPGVEWKDVVYHAAHGLKARVYRPSSPVAAEKEEKKLPVLVYFHGGGYCLGSYAQPSFHVFCLRAAAELPAVVLSVQYRLAPEHRLPAAIHDGEGFLSWLRAQAETRNADPWLADSADFARTFVSGCSAGANLAHHVTVQAAASSGIIDSSPVPFRIAGFVLLSAFFSGVQRTPAEIDLSPADVSLTADMADQLWRMALPAGATRDHPLANPFGPETESSGFIAAVELPPVLVVAPGIDVLRDRVLGYAAAMRELGKDVELARFEGEQHGFSVSRPFSDAADEMMRLLRRFVYQPR